MLSSSRYFDHLRAFWKLKELRNDKPSEVGRDSVELHLCRNSLGALLSSRSDGCSCHAVLPEYHVQIVAGGSTEVLSRV